MIFIYILEAIVGIAIILIVAVTHTLKQMLDSYDKWYKENNEYE